MKTILSIALVGIFVIAAMLLLKFCTNIGQNQTQAPVDSTEYFRNGYGRWVGHAPIQPSTGSINVNVDSILKAHGIKKRDAVGVAVIPVKGETVYRDDYASVDGLLIELMSLQQVIDSLKRADTVKIDTSGWFIRETWREPYYDVDVNLYHKDDFKRRELFIRPKDTLTGVLATTTKRVGLFARREQTPFLSVSHSNPDLKPGDIQAQQLRSYELNPRNVSLGVGYGYTIIDGKPYRVITVGVHVDLIPLFTLKRKR